jgi:hypothetical protein
MLFSFDVWFCCLASALFAVAALVTGLGNWMAEFYMVPMACQLQMSHVRNESLTLTDADCSHSHTQGFKSTCHQVELSQCML